MTANDMEELNHGSQASSSAGFPLSRADSPEIDGDDSQLSRPEDLTTPALSSRAPSIVQSAADIAGGVPAPRHTNDKKINEEYKIWKKNMPFLYDLFMMTATQFPSYTVDWISDVEQMVDENTNAEYQQQKIVLGTTARNDEEITLNGIILMNVRFPVPDPDGLKKMDDKNPEFRPYIGLFSGSPNIMTVHGIIPQSFPITHVRVMPQKNELVCAKLADSTVVIFDWKNELKGGWSYDDPIVERPPMLELAGHDTKLGSSHGLSWNPTSPRAGLIASCDKDGKILVWDISGARRRSDVQPYITFTGHNTEVQDVAWHPLHSTLLGSSGLDGSFCLFDIRSKLTDKPSHRVAAHQSSVNAISFALSQAVLATGSDDGTVALWDMRNLSRKLHSLNHHTGDVFTVDWCHDVERSTLLVTGGADRRVCVWDVAKINDAPETVAPGLPDVPAELVFVHGGHGGRVTDVTWNPATGRKLMIASVSEDAVVQVWTPARYQVWPLDHRNPHLKVRETVLSTTVPDGTTNHAPAEKAVAQSASLTDVGR